MTQRIEPLCWWCKHLYIHESGTYRCDAFGDRRIPDEIWLSDFDHRYSHAEDNGIQFQELEDISLAEHNRFDNLSKEQIMAWLETAKKNLDLVMDSYDGIPSTPFEYKEEDWDE